MHDTHFKRRIAYYTYTNAFSKERNQNALVLASCEILKCIVHTSSLGTKLKIQLQERNQNTTTLGEPTQPEGKSRNNACLGSNLPSDP
jgi:hypothetical protein